LYWRDKELRTYLLIILSVTVITVIALMLHHTYTHLGTAFIDALFTVASLSSTTGFVAAPFSTWPTFVPFLIMMTAIIGGCAASTCGGVKVMRALLLYKQGTRELKRIVHPKAVITVKFGKQILPEHIIQAIWGFISIFFALYVVLLLLLLATGLNFTTAYGGLTACLTNAGAGIGDVATNFAGINTTSKWILIFAMLAGRLEIFTLLVLFTPTFWRH